jgi:hypothetical protein
MKKVIFLTIAIGFGAVVSASENTGEGHRRLARHHKAAKERAKQGYAKSMYEGAKYGAATGFVGGAIGSFAISQGNISAHKPIASGYGQMVEPYVVGTVVGLGLGALAGIWNEAFYSNSTPEWKKQIELLAANKDSISKESVFYFGVPIDQKQAGKAYLVSTGFNNRDNIYNDNHYELYLMPKDKFLVLIFLICDYFFTNHFTDKVSFIAMRPTPKVTKSPYNSKNMPRIIVGFKPGTKKPDIENAIEKLDARLRERLGADYNQGGLNIQPRYSQKLNDLMYAGFGSPDFKDSARGKKEYANKVKTFWQRWISGPTDDDMAYKDSNLAIRSISEEL